MYPHTKALFAIPFCFPNTFVLQLWFPCYFGSFICALYFKLTPCKIPPATTLPKPPPKLRRLHNYNSTVNINRLPFQYSSFSVIGFRFYRICRFYRIMRELKKSKMSPQLGSEPRHLWDLWFSSPACYPSAISPVCWSLSPLDPYIVMLYWFLDLEIFWHQYSMTTLKLECPFSCNETKTFLQNQKARADGTFLYDTQLF